MKAYELFDKEVISIKDGQKLGEISDFEVDVDSGGVVSLIMQGKLRMLGLLGREKGFVIPWRAVKVIGEDTILVDTALCEDFCKDVKETTARQTKPAEPQTPDCSDN